MFTYQREVVVTTAKPGRAPVSGGTQLTIQGHHFQASNMLRCRLDAVPSDGAVDDGADAPAPVVVVARWVSSTTVICAVPAAAPGLVAISVSNNGVDFSSSTAAFEYVPVVAVSGVAPAMGPVVGGTLVEVTGANFVYSPTLACRFGALATVPAVYMSSTKLLCQSPSQVAGPQAVTVTTNGVDYSQPGDVVFTFYHPPTVSAVVPASGPVGGGTTASVMGAGFSAIDNPGGVFCRFGHASAAVLAQAAVVSDTEVRCVVPQSPGGSPKAVPVEVSINGGSDFTANAVQYRYQAVVLVSHLTPTSGPTDGGTQVTVRGANFVDSERLQCRFVSVATASGNNNDGEETLPEPVVVPAVWLSSSSLNCITPPHVDGDVVVEVTNNGLDFHGAAPFMYAALPVVSTVQPASGPTSGRTTVFVSGTGLVYTPALTCRFDLTSVPATRLDDDTIACVAPPHAVGSVVVSVSTNGVDYSAPAQSGAFTYAPLPVITSLTPRAGSTDGSTSVLVTGSGFLDSDGDLACRFGTTPAAAVTFVSPTQVECVAPAASEPGPVAVEVAVNGADFSASAVTFRYLLPAAVSHAVPASAVTTGGTPVAVHGAGFVDSDLLLCRFGALTPVAARWISATVLMCDAPAAAAGPAAIAVSNNAVDFTTTTAAFAYLPRPAVSAVVPSSGAAVGGTRVQVHGSGFAFGRALACRFGLASVAASFVNETLVTCVAPRLLPGVVPLTVTNNGMDYSTPVDPPVAFTSVNVVAVSTLSPRVGRLSGGTVVTVQGSGFTDTPHLACAFDGERVAATYMDDATLTCEAPASVDAKSVAVEVTANGVDYTANAVSFRYVDGEEVAYASPASGPTTGGTAITVFGAGFVDSTLLQCHISDPSSLTVVEVPALLLSPHKVECAMPASSALAAPSGSAPASVLVHVSNNGQQRSTSAASFSYYATPVTTGATPTHGPITGRTRVAVTGSGFSAAAAAATAAVSCRFGYASAPAVVESDGLLTCVAPSVASATQVPVSVSFNGVDFVEALPAFSYTPGPSPATLAPLSGSYAGGSVLTITGGHFPTGDPAVAGAVTCVFDPPPGAVDSPVTATRATPATIVSKSEMTCVTPAMPEGASRVSVGWGDNLYDIGSVAFFHFRSTPEVVRVRPRWGPEAGGTAVAVFGAKFEDTHALACRFALPAAKQANLRPEHAAAGGVVVPATFVSAAEVRCASPNVAQATDGAVGVGDLTVTVANNGVDFSAPAAAATFTITPDTSVTSVLPAVGSPSGGTVVRVFGQAFANTAELSCVFGFVSAPATFVSASEVRCVSPASHRGAELASVRVSNNGVEYGRSQATFMYAAAPTVDAIVPEVGPVTGGTTLEISGAGFLPSVPEEALARTSGIVDTDGDEPFDASAVAATIAASATPLCAFGVGAGRIVVPATASADGTSLTCVTPPWDASASDASIHAPVVVQVSTNGVDFSVAGAPFRYRPVPVVVSVTPSHGPERGGTSLTVKGSGFANSGDLSCVFVPGGVDNGADAALVVPARWVSALVVVCDTPEAAPSTAGWSVHVSNTGGRHKSTTAAPFTMEPLALLESVTPAAGPEMGGTVVTVSGTNFVSSAGLVCLFGGIARVPAEFVDVSTVRCVTPPSPTVGATELRVSRNGVDFSDEAVTFTFAPQRSVVSVSPVAGGVAGGVTVAVSGPHVGDITPGRDDAVACRFGDADPVPATVVDDDTITCVTPAFGASGTVPVEVSLPGGQAFTTSGVLFEYLPRTSLRTVTPPRAFDVGGTALALAGAGFVNKAGMQLWLLGSDATEPVSVPVIYHSPVLLAAIAPPLHGGRAKVVLGAATAPPASAFASSSVTIDVVPLPSLETVEPSYGRLAGGTTIHLRGRHFVRSPNLRCVFTSGVDNTVSRVPASFISDTSVSCITPRLATLVAMSETDQDVPATVALSFFPRGEGGDVADTASSAFTFVPSPDTLELSPSTGPSTGGTQVTIYGDFARAAARDDASALCRFGDVDVAATTVAATMMQCAAPAAAPATQLPAAVPVLVSTNGVDFTAVTGAFTYQPPVWVSSVAPNSGHELGGTRVTVVGSGFVSSSALACRFSAPAALDGSNSESAPAWQVVQATWVSTTEVRCLSPPSATGSSRVGVANNGVDFTDGDGHAALFEFLAAPDLQGVQPAFGPVSGGTVVSVRGANFVHTPTLACRFGATAIVPASFVSASEVACVAPPAQDAGSVAVAVTLNGQEWVTGDTTGADDGALPVSFTHVAVPHVSSIVPASGPSTGGTLVTLSVAHAPPSGDLWCKFGDAADHGLVVDGAAASADPRVVKAVVADADDGSYTCVVPRSHPQAGQGIGFGTGVVPVRLSVNGQQWHATSASFLYLEPAVAYTVTPNFVPALTAGAGSLVTVHGDHFVNTNSLYCQFGDSTPVRAVYLSPQAVQCPVPLRPVGEVELSLSLNGRNFGTGPEGTPLPFAFVPTPTVTALSPASGITHGGTTVTVTGTGFAYTPELACRFGDSQVPARFISATQVQCTSPPSMTVAVGAAAGGVVTVEVTTNGVTYTTDAAQFMYAQPSRVSSLLPATGPASGGTDVDVRGVFFTAHSTRVACVFTGPAGWTQRLEGTLVSESLVRCTTPVGSPAVQALLPAGTTVDAPGADVLAGAADMASQAGEVVQVTVEVGGVPSWGAALPFRFVPDASTLSMTPVTGPETGDTAVTVRGAGFLSGSSLACRFTAVADAGVRGSGLHADRAGTAADVAAAWVNATAVQCVTPQLAPGAYLVSVTNNGADFTRQPLRFDVVPTLQLASVSPQHGPVQGDTVVTVRGNNFVFSPALACRFGLVTVVATFVDTGTLRCVVPASDASGPTPVRVSNNGREFIDAGLTFTYQRRARVDTVVPASGPVTGGTIVEIVGEGFVLPAHLATLPGQVLCRFGNAVAPGVLLSDTRLRCTTPHLANAGPRSLDAPFTGRLAVDVSLNGGADYTASPVRFVVRDTVSVTALDPHYGPETGGSVVEVHGSGFQSTAHLACRFGEEGASGDAAPRIVGARFVSSSMVVCISPPGVVGSSPVEVTLNGAQWSSDSVQFEFHGPADTYTVVPATGPLQGGTPIVVTGTNFVFSEDLRCWFDGLEYIRERAVRAAFINGTAVQCLTPPNTAGTVAVSVLVSPEELPTSSASFTYRELPQVHSLSPSSGPTSGGVSVTITGAHFDGREVLCRFGGGMHLSGSSRMHMPSIASGVGADSVTSRRLPAEELPWVEAKVVDNATVVCVAPPSLADEGPRPVEVSSNGGVDWSQNGVMFTYRSNAFIESLAPASGPELGGTTITLHGGNFVPLETLQCRFAFVANQGGNPSVARAPGHDVVTVPAVWLSHSRVQCVTPQHEPGTVAVEVSRNAQSFTASDVRFQYYTLPHVHSVSPLFGPPRGGTSVVVRGEHFTRDSGMACRFGPELAVPAVFVSSNEVRCSAPEHPEGVVDVVVAVNGRDWSDTSAPYTYSDAHVSAIMPVAGSTTGGTLVTVLGAGFAATGTTSDGRELAPFVECVFFPSTGRDASLLASEATHVAAVVVDDSTVECVSPPAPIGIGSVSVEVIRNRQDVTDSQKQFAYLLSPSVTKVTPAFAPERNPGTHVSVQGSNFVNNDGLACVVDFARYAVAASSSDPAVEATHLVLPAAFVSAAEISCTLPPLQAAVYRVEVTNNRMAADASRNGVEVTMTPAMDITTISPSHGTVAGGTFVTMSVTNLPQNGETVWCVFGADRPGLLGDVEFGETKAEADATAAALPVITSASSTRVPGFVTGPSSLQCVSPRVGMPGVATVAITVNGVHMARQLAEFEYHALPVVEAVEPAFGSTHGGTEVTITGTGFFAGDNVQCRFGTAPPVAGEVVSATQLRCTVPAPVSVIAYGPVPVQVALNGQDFTRDGVIFTYRHPPLITSLSPTSATEVGGTVITVYGSAFVDSKSFACVFRPRRALGDGDRSAHGKAVPQTVPALFVSSTVAQCVAPALPPGHVEVEITNNGQEWTADRVPFRSLARVFVRNLAPAIGPVHGGTRVEVHGSGFVFNGNLRCMFGFEEVPASFVSSELVVCSAPAHSPGSVHVQVSTGHSDFSEAAAGAQGYAVYQYEPPAVVEAVFPDAGPATGGTEVTVTGAHFLTDLPTVCQFGSEQVPATVHSSTNLTCVSPPVTGLDENAKQGSMPVAVEVTTLGGKVSQSGVRFRYLTPVAVTAVSPTTGPELGGTLVRVTGYNFVSSPTLGCVFVLAEDDDNPVAAAARPGDRDVFPARWLSPTSLECRTPRTSPSRVRLEVTNNGKDITTSGVAFTFARAAAVQTVSPASGPPTGGTIVTVTGQNFVAGGRLLCMFGSTTVYATFVSSSELSCPAPPHLPATVAVEVALNGVDYTTDGVTFQFRDLARVQALSPRAGSSSGGTLVTLVGAGFDPNTTLCRFGDLEPQQPQEFVSDTEVKCVAPAAPRLFLGFVFVEITNNGQDYSASGMTFQYLPQQVVTSVKPLTGPDSGGTVVTVLGVNFVSSDLIQCAFGDSAPVRARWLSSGQLECVTPTHVPGSVSVEVTNNGVDYTSNGVQFTFDPMPAVLRLEPDTGPLVGATAVTVHGIHFTRQQSWCRFGVRTVPAMFVSSTVVKCSSPPHAEGPVAVEVTNNRVDYTSNGVQFFYRRLPLVLSLDPFFGPDSGGTFVHITMDNGTEGGDFRHSNTTLCRIGDATVPAVVDPLTGKVTGCRMPASANVKPAGSRMYSVDISSNGLDWTRSNVQYDYVSPVAITAATPHRASSAGGDEIIVSGSNFTNTARLACQFGDVSVSAFWLSPGQMRCVAPRHVKSKVLLRVTNNGVDWSASAVLFEFHTDAVVLSISPNHGPVRGQTRVVVRGFNFVQSRLSVCKFGEVLEPMLAFVSSTEIVCMSPPRLQHAGSVSLEVTNNNASFSDNGVQFRYDARINVALLAPDAGPTRGGSLVLVHGSQFLDTPDLKCRFGHKVVDAQYLNAGQLQCTSPPNPPGLVPVEVATNGVDFSFSTTLFDYVEDTIITSIDPWRGPALKGRGVVTVRGSGFRNTVHLACLFGGTLSQATWRDATTIVCRIPPAMPGLVNFEVTSNGADFTQSGLQFLYDRDASVQKLYPNRGLHTGQVPVFVRGSNFVNSTSLKCSFGDLKVRALFLKPTLVMCMAPSRVAGSVRVTGPVPVEVANNGADFTTSGVLYDYLETCPARHYCPHLNILPCPNGTFCEGDSLFNFSLCQPGTFQPRMKQDQCLDCPLGYFCPDFGMSKPKSCSPGFVCDELGLVSPTNPCPAGHFCPQGTKTGDPMDFYGAVRPDLNDTEWVLDVETGILTFNASVRPWEILTRELPATGTYIIEHPPEGWDRATGKMSKPLLAERPHPCPLGEFCRTGVSTNVSVPKNFSTPQPCFRGFFCPRGSASPEGKGPCPTGFYCPTTTEAYICSRGHYCPGVGNVRPIECYPGTYNPLQQQSNCTLCPPGHVCPGWGRLEPAICPAGFVCLESALSQPVVQCPAGFWCEEGTLVMPFVTDDALAKYNINTNETSQGRRLIEDSILDLIVAEARAQVLASLVSGTAAPTWHIIANNNLVPKMCARGTFCLGGVAHQDIIEWKPADPRGSTAPQLCTEGTFCEQGTESPAGSGSCYLGHYCPPGVDIPIEAPIGNFVSKNGSVVPTMCFPGTYAPLVRTSNCRVCPAGYTCQSYSTYRPQICGIGTYRSLANSITCRLCPQGTWSQITGLTSVSMCEPCPAGRVCGVEKMTNLSQSVACPDGHICGEGTTKAKQFAHQCPAGYFCFEQTAPLNQFDNMCEKGHYCWRGTKGFLKNRNKCAVGFYCPAGTSDGFPEETRCPKGTTTASGSAELIDCFVEQVKICDKQFDKGVSYYPKFSYNFQGEDKLIDDGENEVAVLREINPVNESASDPYWQNDTIDVFRSCDNWAIWADPATVTAETQAEAPWSEVIVLGLRFVDRPSLMCRIQFGNITTLPLPDGYELPRELILPAEFVSQSRVKCRWPSTHFRPVYDQAMFSGRGGYRDLEIRIANDGISWSENAAMVYNYPAEARLRHAVETAPDSAPSIAELTDEQKQQRIDDCLLHIREPDLEVVPYDVVNQWYELRGMSMAKLQFDFRHLPPEFEYDWHYKIAIYVDKSQCTEILCDANRNLIEPTPLFKPCTQPIEFSDWFLDRSVLKQDLLNISILALEDVKFHVEMHITYGLFLPLSWQLRNTTTVTIFNPTRANATFGVLGPATRRLSEAISFERREVTKDYSFLAVYERGSQDDTSAPLNLPVRFKDFERGRVLPMFNVSYDEEHEGHVPWVKDPFESVKPGPEYWEAPSGDLGQLIEDYREIFHDSSETDAGDYEYAFETLVLPYLPYFSSCSGYDSYIPIFALMEDPACDYPEELDEDRLQYPPLPHADDIKHVGPGDVGGTPIADVCARSMVCRYEEDLPNKDVTPRWFESASGVELFSIIRKPFSLEDMFKGGELPAEVEGSDGADAFIGMGVDRDAAEEMKGECTRLCLPREMSIEIAYYQFTPNLKRLISIDLVFDGFDRNTRDDRYALSFEMVPLDYLNLVINFAFPLGTFLLLFCAIGALAVAFTAVYWVFHRLTTRLETPPKMRFFNFFYIITPAPMAGVVLALIPVGVVLWFILILIHGYLYFGNEEEPWMLDDVYGHFMDTKIDPKKIEHNRFGRVGLMFMVIGWYLIIVGALIFLPKRVSKREKEIEMKRDKAAEKESVWRPTMWKRSNMVLTSIVFALFLTLIVEFSFWEEFGTWIWHIIVGLKFVAVWAEWTLEAQVKEYLLMCPLVSAMDLIQGLVTFGADDFADFIQAFFIEFALLITERIYIGPGTGIVVDYCMEKLTQCAVWLRKKLKLKRKLLIEAQAQKEGDDADAMKQRDIDIDVEGGETVEPILDAFAGYANETLALFYQPFMIMLLMVFRAEIQIPDIYGIREQDMQFYLWFQIVILFFQLSADMLMHNVQELFHGWKLYDYLVYTRYRFLQRETRWKGLEDSLDECIEEGMRTLDQMCFSSQFYMMSTIHTTGVIFVIFSLEMMIRIRYNGFGDPAMLLLIPATLLMCRITQWACVFVADKIGIWQIKHANTAWHSSIGDDEDDDFGIPRWDELEKIKGASHEAYLMNQRITSETFRHKFLDYNRPWLVAQLPSILTPRTLRRSRPYLVAQFTKILGSVNPDISSDTESDDDNDRFGPVTLSASSRTLIRLWLAQARRKLRLKEVVQGIINRNRRPECEQCLSRHQLQVELVIPIEELGERFEEMHPDMEEFDQVAWKVFFQKHEKFRTLCLNCIAKNKDHARAQAAAGIDISASDDDDPHGFGPIYLQSASKALMQLWLIKARNRIGAGGGRKRVVVSSDDEDDDLAVAAPWARQPVNLNASSAAIARKWLALARDSRRRGGVARPNDLPSSAIGASRIKPSKAPTGKRSRFRRK